MKDNEYEILNRSTLRRVFKDFPTVKDAYEYVKNLNRGYGSYELYNQSGHKIIKSNAVR